MSKVLQSITNYAESHANTPAVIENDGATTYKALYKKIITISSWLSSAMVSQVGLLSDNSNEWIAFDLACINENITMVPLPSFFSSDQIEHVLQATNLDLLIVQEKYINRFDHLHWDHKTMPLPVEGYVAFISSGSQVYDKEQLIGSAKITFTSGSTGYPKGVCLSQDTLEEVLMSVISIVPLDHIKYHLSMLPFSILLENVLGIYTVLVLGKAIIIPDEDTYSLSSFGPLKEQQMIELFHNHSPNSLIMMPAHLALLLKGFELSKQSFKSLKFGAVGGAHVNPKLLSLAQQFGLPIYEGYGLSECGSVVSINVPEANKIGSSGRILPHVKYEISKEKELIIYNPTMLGYLKSSSKIEKIHTGDLVELDEHGYLKILGRKKNIIINALGRNISPEWIETELLKSENILQVCIHGEGKLSLSASIFADPHIPSTRIQKDVDEANRKLPNYAKVTHWTRMPYMFTVENGLLSPQLLPNRNKIQQLHENQMQLLTNKGETA